MLKYLKLIILALTVLSTVKSAEFVHLGDKIDSLPENIEIFQRSAENSPQKPEFKLSDFKGKKAVLFYFLKPGCGSCDQFSPHLYRLLLKNKDDLAVVGVSGLAESPAQSVNDFAQHCLGGYPVIRDPSHEFVVKMIGKIDKFPYLVLLDKEGTVVWYGRGKFHAQVTDEVNRVLEGDTRQKVLTPQKRYVMIVGANTSRNLKAVANETQQLVDVYKNKAELYQLISKDGDAVPADTVINLKTKLTEIAAKAGEKDSILFFFAGDAMPINGADGKIGLELLLADGKISLDALSEILKANSKCKNIAFVIDANRQDSNLAVWEDIALGLEKQYPDLCLLLSASRWDRSNLNSEQNNTIFGEYFLSGLKDERFSASIYELWRYIRDRMSHWSRENATLQSPFIINENIGAFRLTVQKTNKEKPE